MEIKVSELINYNQITKDQAIEIDSTKGRITSIRNLTPLEMPEYHRVVPGFIDIHTHGRMGCSAMNILNDNYMTLSAGYLRSGTTTFLASLLTAPLEEIRTILHFGRQYIKENKKQAERGQCALLYGFHLEGPYISTQNRGAQNPKHIIPYDERGKSLIEDYHDIIRMITLDYQNPSAYHLVQDARQYQIILSAGHDSAVGDKVYEGIAEGISHVTHIFSSTSSFFKGVKDGVFVKLLGTQEVALMTEGITVEIIPDEHHITKSIYTFIKHCKPVKEIIAVSDSTEYSGLPYEPGKLGKLGELDIMLEDGVAMLPNKSTLAGSIITLHDAFKILVNKWGEKLTNAVALTSYNPAKKLGCADLGVVEAGAQADIVVLDNSNEIVQVFKHGIAVTTQ